MSSLIQNANPDFDFQGMQNYILELTPSLLKYSDGFENQLKGNLLKDLHTILHHGRWNSTYNANDNSFYCRAYDNRTITDIFRLCKFYYSEVSVIDVYDALLQHIENRSIISWICRDIHKRTWQACDFGGGFNSQYIDEYGINFPRLKVYQGYGSYNGRSDLIFENFNNK